MGIAEFLTDIAEGLTTFLPAFATAMVDTFIKLFFTVASEGGAVTGLNPLGTITVAFFVIGLGRKIVPTVLGWLKARSKKSRV